MNGNYGMAPWYGMGTGMFPGGGNPYFSPYFSPWAAPGGMGPVMAPPTGVLDDSEMASYVRDNIDLDPYISVRDKNNIDVDVSGGTAKLTGMVTSRRSKGLAYADAFWVPGILDVEDELTVQEPKKTGERGAK